MFFRPFFLLVLLVSLLFACTPKKEIQYESTRSSNQSASQPEPWKPDYQVYTGSEFIKTTLDKAPQPNGGEQHFYMSMYREMRYPPDARQRRVQGTVEVEVVIRETGILESAQIVKGIGAGCDEEALKAVQRGCMNGFEPAIKDGIPVKVKYIIPVNFRLE